jgi:phosphatidylglycerophosphate synthase
MSDAPLQPQKQNAEYGRPNSIEEFSNQFIVHPLSTVLAKVAIKLGISANIVSFLGLGAGWLAAFFYFQQPALGFVFAGFLAMFAWHVLDGADGRVARATGTSSAFGRIIDGICDHLVFGAVYIAITLYLIKTGSPLTIWFLALAAGLSHAVQAAGYEERRQKYQRRSRGITRADVTDKLLSVDGKKSTLAGIYDAAQRLVSGGISPLDQRLEEMRAAKRSDNEVQAVINKTSKIVRAWALLNANNRTIMIAVMAAIAQPALYFVYEITILNIVLIGLLIYERRAEARIAGEATL